MNRRRARSEATVGHIQNEFMLKFHGKANFVSKEGILVQPNDSHRDEVMRWLEDEHGSAMASLTTEDIMRLIQED